MVAPTALDLLILEDRLEDAELLVLELSRVGFDPRWQLVETQAQFEASLDPNLDLILADYSLPQFNALKALMLLKQRQLDIPFIVVTGSFEQQAIECMKRGAADYLLKDRLGRLGLSVRQVLQDRRLRAEKRLAQQRALRQDRMAAVGQLAAGIAPSFSEILAAIILHSEMVLGSFELSRRDEDRIRTILKQAERGAFLTRQILDFSLRSRLEPIAVDLTQFIEQFESAVRPSLPRSIQLHVSSSAEVAEIEADPSRLHQALLNLVENAREAMPEGGELRIQLEGLRLGPEDLPPLSELPPGVWFRLRVADTGRGISESHLPHIFEPFFTTKRADQGAGLGLSQAYGIVKQHGGHLAVASFEGRGTEFELYLPASEGVPRLEPISNRPVGSRETRHLILVVDDDQPTRQAVCELLESLGYHTLQAGDGQAALERLQDEGEKISLVLTDLVMPQVGGVELLHRMRPMGIELPVVLMTSYPLGSQSEALLEGGLVGWLEKPLTGGSLVRALRAVLPPPEAG